MVPHMLVSEPDAQVLGSHALLLSSSPLGIVHRGCPAVAHQLIVQKIYRDMHQEDETKLSEHCQDKLPAFLLLSLLAFLLRSLIVENEKQKQKQEKKKKGVGTQRRWEPE